MPPFRPFILIAAFDWEKILPIVFVIVYIVNYLLNLGKQPPGRNVPRRNVNPERAARPRPPVPAGSQDELNREIEDFLKRANEARRDPSKRLPEAPVSGAPRRPLTPDQPSAAAPVDVELVDASRLSDNVSASVERHLGSSGRTEQMAEDIARDDAAMEQHIQQKFGHRLGTLHDTSQPQVGSAAGLATDESPHVAEARVSPLLASAIANRDNLRQAFILNEIITRQEDRWD